MDKNPALKRRQIINLKTEGDYFIDQYVHLRNNYAELLLTSVVNIAETKEWLKKSDIEVRGLIRNNILLGAVILYLNKDGEIAFFVKQSGKGIGSRLIKIIEEVAKEKKLQFIWAWVINDNLIAQRVFIKNKFVKEAVSERPYRGAIKTGITYKKILDNKL